MFVVHSCTTMIETCYDVYKVMYTLTINININQYLNFGYILDFVDSSGLRFTYTSKLRDQDIGTLEIGTVPGIAVPPKPDNFRVEAYCSSDCVNQACDDVMCYSEILFMS